MDWLKGSMVDYSYKSAPREYFTRFHRTIKGFQGLKQKFLPKSAVLKKERYFGWAQSIYLTNVLASAGLLDENRKGHDAAIVGSGLPFLGEQLHVNGIKAVSIDPNKNLAQLVNEELTLRHNFLSGDAIPLPLENYSVSMTASHNFLQKMPSEDYAKKAVSEMLRIAKDYVIIQVTPKEHPYFRGDDTHTLALSEEAWKNLIGSAAIEHSQDWRLAEVHKVKIAHSVSAGRPPVFILERGSHPKQKRDYDGITHLTKATWIVQDEATPANLISAARPVATYLGIKELDGMELSAFLSVTMATDALDGIIARKTGPSPMGNHVDRMSDHATECIAMFGLGFPVIPYVHVVRDSIVDGLILAGRVNESGTSRQSLLSRGGYGVLKTAAFVTKPIIPEVGDALGYASTAVSIERAVELVRHAKLK